MSNKTKKIFTVIAAAAVGAFTFYYFTTLRFQMGLTNLESWGIFAVIVFVSSFLAKRKYQKNKNKT